MDSGETFGQLREFAFTSRNRRTGKRISKSYPKFSLTRKLNKKAKSAQLTFNCKTNIIHLGKMAYQYKFVLQRLLF